MKRSLKAVIFDLDGVIVDTFELYYCTNKKIADQLSVPFNRADNEMFRGIGREKIIEELEKRSHITLSEEERKKLADEKNAHYQQLIQSMDKSFLLPGIKEFILELKEHSIKMAIASSSTNAKTVLGKVGLLPYFDYIVDPRTLVKGKPDSEIFIKAAEKLEIQEVDCAAIEDGVAGLRAIKSTKMYSIGIGEAVKHEKPDWYINHTEEISYKELKKKFEG